MKHLADKTINLSPILSPIIVEFAQCHPGQVICIIKDSYDLSLTLPRDYSETTWRIVQSNYFLYNTVNIGYFRARSPENIQQFCNLHDSIYRQIML
jgi:hypothetical protein